MLEEQGQGGIQVDCSKAVGEVKRVALEEVRAPSCLRLLTVDQLPRMLAAF